MAWETSAACTALHFYITGLCWYTVGLPTGLTVNKGAYLMLSSPFLSSCVCAPLLLLTYDRKQVLFERIAQVAGWEAARCQLGLLGCWSDCFSLLITTPAGVLRRSVLRHSEGIHNYNTLSTSSPSSLHTPPSPPPPIYSSVLLFLLCSSSEILLASSNFWILLWHRSTKHLQWLW